MGFYKVLMFHYPQEKKLLLQAKIFKFSELISSRNITPVVKFCNKTNGFSKVINYDFSEIFFLIFVVKCLKGEESWK